MATTATIDGNEAAARIAHLTNEVVAIYPITPASPMGEHADAWSAQQQPNLWGDVPSVVELQSEGGAAGAIHGALQAGALTTTFTASQGLLLMLPNMYKIAGELTPTVFHIAARSVAAQALSIFGDHSDVMAARATGFAMLASNSPQEVMDLALIAQAATLEARVPFLHFFDGFRTSHEVAKIETVSEEVVRALLDQEAIRAHRARALSPEHPAVRGTAQNPDVFFQARETVNPFYAATPGIVAKAMDRFAELTGRRYRPVDYVGHPEAERVLVLMGSGAETAHETVECLARAGAPVGVLKVRLFRPFPKDALLEVLPGSVRALAVLDRTKEPGAAGEPLYQDVLTTLAEAHGDGRLSALPRVIGGRFGLSSKEFTPAMVRAVLDELDAGTPKNHFTIGIHDDVGHTSLPFDERWRTDAHDESFQAVFYGLGSDGTVSANKNAIRIIGEETDLHAQGYFVYDSKKSGAVTVSHLRFGPEPIRSSYLIGAGEADFVACHQPVFLDRFPMLDAARDGAVFLLNTPEAPEAVLASLPATVRAALAAKHVRLHAIDAVAVAAATGMGKRINTIMQTCFFAISGVLPREEALAHIKAGVEKTYGRRGARVVERNFAAIDATLEALHEIPVDGAAPRPEAPAQTTTDDDASEFVQRVTREILAGRGDLIPVSQLPVDGTFPVGTAKLEKRNLALEIPLWETDLCTQCGKCPMVCPHAAIRSKIFDEAELEGAPEGFLTQPVKAKGFPEGARMTYQVAPEDCTGCGLCVDICPIRDKSNASRKALNMAPQPSIRERERANWDFFLGLSEYPRADLKPSNIRDAMVLEPLFEFSGACVGCGETPYLKLASQLFGDRMLVANATGCSSIYGGNLPTTPWAANADGRGPAWSNSLFEDNAEFGLGMRIALDAQRQQATTLLARLRDAGTVDGELAGAILDADEHDEAQIDAQRARVAQLRAVLAQAEGDDARRLSDLADVLCRRSVWIVGGDGWAYDIGYGGLDHVLASDRDVNILVLDTEVYSNTGGQTSKATPLGAVAKFSAGGKPTAKKDLALLAMDYGHVYVAHVAYGAKDTQTLHAFLEAEAHPGPSLIIAYSPCIAHGVDLSNNHRQQNLAVNSGHWPLFRFDPAKAEAGKNPLKLDSKKPSVPLADFMRSETRFEMLWRTHPEDAERFLAAAQREVDHRWHYYEQLAQLDFSEPTSVSAVKAAVVGRGRSEED